MSVSRELSEVGLGILTSPAVKFPNVRSGTQQNVIQVNRIALAGELVFFIRTLKLLIRFETGLIPSSP